MPEYPHSTSLQYLVEEDYMGVNAPIIHQSVIARLTAGLYPLYRSGQVPFEPLPETMLTEGYASPVPDVILYDHQAEQTRIIVEVCQTNGQKNDLKKVVWLIEENEYGIVEGFVFNYKTHVWLRYKKGDGGAATDSSSSDVLNLDLNDFL
ncbi:hypothetical protein [Spirosoma pomorum]|jgi:hypothetical protein